ncbi:hypothetical protein PAMA_005433 [Pampus argenteus]
MSAGVVDIQAQVESILAALLKVATVELTTLFESRYRASALDVQVGRAKDGKENETLEGCSTGEEKRSVGVQVDGDIYPQVPISGPPLISDGDCLRECREEEEEGEEEEETEEADEVEGCFIQPDIPLKEDYGCDNPEWPPLKEQVTSEWPPLKEQVTSEWPPLKEQVTSEWPPLKEQVTSEWPPLKEQVVAETVDMVEISVLETESPKDSGPQTEAIFHVSADLGCGSSQSSPAEQKLLVIQPDKSDVSSGDKVKFVCPLIFKPESPAPKPDSTKKSVQAEPQQACVSTAKGTAYSPSPSDGAVTPAQDKVWELTHTPKDKKNHFQMKLKLTSPDKKLMRPCAVQLVNVLTVPEKEVKLQDHGANSKTGWPKDLRRHQGLHTGHRLCCFTSCGNGIWRLRKVVTHSRDGYACSICRKTFKRRKILRRHERFHTGEKPYPCSACSKTFALRKSLRRHLRFHTGERPHTCTQCGKSFRLRDNLKAHLRFHTGEKPYSCATCGKMFRITRNLEKHQLSQCGFFVPSFRTIAGIKM